MAVTILEALMNAKFNIVDQPNAIGLMVGREQLLNAVTLLKKGCALDDEVEPLLEEYGDIESVPER